MTEAKRGDSEGGEKRKKKRVERRERDLRVERRRVAKGREGGMGHGRRQRGVKANEHYVKAKVELEVEENGY